MPYSKNPTLSQKSEGQNNAKKYYRPMPESNSVVMVQGSWFKGFATRGYASGKAPEP
jgi:hypothetical protein